MNERGGEDDGRITARELVRVLRARKRLLVVPAVGGVVLTGAAGALLALEVRTGFGTVTTLLGVAVLVLISTLANAVLTLAAEDALRGRPVRLRRAVGRAARRLPGLAAWSVTSTAMVLVSAVLLFALSWGTSGYLTVPAMVVDGLGLREAVRTSKALHRQDRWASARGATWIAVPLAVTMVPAVIVFLLGLTAHDRTTALSEMIAAGLCLALAVTATVALSGLLRTRLYLHLTRPGAAVQVSVVGPALTVSAVEEG
ncbi:hypothetical protein [Kitasatospora sp. NPDC101183]|uniref:hypothetical protein n=1 Tax=Kitasatospora sp. NPDC101183 TaxID=3364100 RepID=UPI00380467A4